jgi:hypothetical protein
MLKPDLKRARSKAPRRHCRAGEAAGEMYPEEGGE